jgi:hypothetical protein
MPQQFVSLEEVGTRGVVSMKKKRLKKGKKWMKYFLRELFFYELPYLILGKPLNTDTVVATN